MLLFVDVHCISACAAGSHCLITTNTCLLDVCVPDCEGRVCGDDKCGGSCGSCSSSGSNNSTLTSLMLMQMTQAQQQQHEREQLLLCVDATGQCERFETCNNQQPVCRVDCSKLSGSNSMRGELQQQEQFFCGNDCKCHAHSTPPQLQTAQQQQHALTASILTPAVTISGLPDLIVKELSLVTDVLLDTHDVHDGSCALIEQCVRGTGVRRLLRFTVSIGNQGTADINLPDPTLHPDLYVWSSCHKHYHYK